MLFESSVRKELARSFGATLVVIGTIVLTILLIRTLGQAANGAVSPSDVSLLLGYTLLGHLPTLLALSLFVACVGVLSRMYRDSEMVIWFSSGSGLASTLRPLLRFAWPILLGIGVLALIVWPWSHQQVQQLRDRFDDRGDVERITPGQFQESASRRRVFFVEKEGAQGDVGNNVFIAATEKGREAVTSAQRARVDHVDGERHLILQNGQRTELQLSDRSVKVSEFTEYVTRVGAARLQEREVQPPKATNSLDLVRVPSPANLGELAWRIGLWLASVNVVLMAVAVASASPRATRTLHLVIALFAFITYYNLLNLGQSWIASGRVGFLSFLVGLHGGALLLALVWLAVRHFQWHPAHLLRRRTP